MRGVYVLVAWTLLLNCAHLGAQSFDRLQLRPRSQGDGTYLPAVLKFCGAADWPTNDPECVGLQAPSEVDRYDLFWPIAAPELPSCIAVNPIGQMSFVACGEGVIFLDPGRAILPPSNPARYSRQFAGFPMAAHVELHAESGDHAQWTFVVPAGFTNQPTLKVWGEAGNNDEMTASVRCVKPENNEVWTAQPFDIGNVGTWLSPGTSGLNQMVLVLANNDSMEPGELCQLDLQKSGGTLITTWLYLTIE